MLFHNCSLFCHLYIDHLNSKTGENWNEWKLIIEHLVVIVVITIDVTAMQVLRDIFLTQ